jgi:nucleotidyltransferase substrate binding protein (TIGR01987 family)
MDDIRWQQRFQNYKKSMTHLTTAVGIVSPDIVQKAGLIQFFEMSFELAWKTMKDYLEAEGYNEIRSPRDTIKKVFEISLIANGHDWLQALEDRNNSSHAYDEEMANEICELIILKYFPLLQDLYQRLLQKWK